MFSWGRGEMVDPITATYVQENDDWTITVAAQGRHLTGRAPGIIAARDRADQLVEKLQPESKGRTVVHLLNGSALEFSATYMNARLTRPSAAEEKRNGVDQAAARTASGTKAAKPDRSRAGARRAAAPKAAPKSGGRRAKKDTADYEGKHADVENVLGSANVDAGAEPVKRAKA